MATDASTRVPVAIPADAPASTTDASGAPPGRWSAFGRFLRPADLRADANVFTIIRCCLASAVIYTHAYGLTGSETDGFTGILPYPLSRLAVLLFFTLSGFMVTGSFVRRGLVAFLTARALRILPGLWTMLIVTTLILGVLVSTLPASTFFTLPGAWGYLGRNMILLGKGTDQLPGVFQANHEPWINRSLWSIPVEVRCYLILAATGMIGLLGRRSWFLAAFVVLLVVTVLPVGAKIVFLPLALAFNTGVVMYLWRDRLFLSWPLAIAAAALALALPVRFHADVAVQLAFSYMAVVAAIVLPAPWRRVGGRAPDYSYGIYIYAFPMQQLAYTLGIGTTPASNIAATLVLTIPLAAASWHLIEHPALQLKSRLTWRQAAR